MQSECDCQKKPFRTKWCGTFVCILYGWRPIASMVWLGKKMYSNIFENIWIPKVMISWGFFQAKVWQHAYWCRQSEKTSSFRLAIKGHTIFKSLPHFSSPPVLPSLHARDWYFVHYWSSAANREFPSPLAYKKV